MEKDLSEGFPQISCNIPLEINISNPEETVDWIKNHGEPWMYVPREIEVGLREKHLFANVKYNQRIIGYCRVGIHRVYISDYRRVFELKQGSAFIYDSYVVADFRNQGVITFLKIKIMEELRRRGFKKIRNHVPPWNTASLKVSDKLGFKKTAHVRHIRILGFLTFCLRKKYA